MRAPDAMPNKPFVPTATYQFDEHSPDSLRRHIGQPFGSFEEQCVTSVDAQTHTEILNERNEAC